MPHGCHFDSKWFHCNLLGTGLSADAPLYRPRAPLRLSQCVRAPTTTPARLLRLCIDSAASSQSTGTFLAQGQDEIIAAVENRISELTSALPAPSALLRRGACSAPIIRCRVIQPVRRHASPLTHHSFLLSCAQCSRLRIRRPCRRGSAPLLPASTAQVYPLRNGSSRRPQAWDGGAVSPSSASSDVSRATCALTSALFTTGAPLWIE